MLNINLELTHSLELGKEVYAVLPDMTVKSVVIKGLYHSFELNEEPDTMVIIEIQDEDKQKGGCPTEDLFLTIEEAEAEVSKRNAEAEDKKIEDLKKLYKAIIDRQAEVVTQLTEKGIDVTSIV